MQLLLWRLYAFLGPVEFCTQLYNNLAIKHIQIDTVGYATALAGSSIVLFSPGISSTATFSQWVPLDSLVSSTEWH